MAPGSTGPLQPLVKVSNPSLGIQDPVSSAASSSLYPYSFFDAILALGHFRQRPRLLIEIQGFEARLGGGLIASLARPF